MDLSKLKIKVDNNRRLISCVIIAFTQLVFSSNYFNNTFPLSEGWFVYYTKLIDSGKFPYRDFYYFLPPLNLVIDGVFWKLSFGYLIIFRAWYLAERIAVYIYLACILQALFDWKAVTLSCMVAEVICTADGFDLFGDYNQHIVILELILIRLAIKFVKTDREGDITKTTPFLLYFMGGGAGTNGSRKTDYFSIYGNHLFCNLDFVLYIK